MSELTVDFWVALSVIPMVIALCIYLWLSRRFDRLEKHEGPRFEELAGKVPPPADGAFQGKGYKPPPIPASGAD